VNDNNEEKKVFQVGNVVKFKDYSDTRSGEIVATRVDQPGKYLVVYIERHEKWVDAEKLELDTMETIVKQMGE